MTPDKEVASKMSTRQKLTAGVFLVILAFLGWQVYGLFGGGSSSPSPAPAPTAAVSANPTGAPPTTPGMMTPTAATLNKPPVAPTTEREQALLLLQQQTEAKYIEAVNELQMLKIERDIAETNKAIMAAKFDTISSQKRIIELFKPAASPTSEPNYQGLVGAPPGTVAKNPAPSAQVTQTTTTVQATQATPDVNYVVISVSQLQGRWSAVLGAQGNLYSVFLGDILPPDRSRVVYIDRSGVVVERNGIRKKFSLVPIL